MKYVYRVTYVGLDENDAEEFVIGTSIKQVADEFHGCVVRQTIMGVEEISQLYEINRDLVNRPPHAPGNEIK